MNSAVENSLSVVEANQKLGRVGRLLGHISLMRTASWKATI